METGSGGQTLSGTKVAGGTKTDKSKSNVADGRGGGQAGSVTTSANIGTSSASDGMRNSKARSTPEPGNKVLGP